MDSTKPTKPIAFAEPRWHLAPFTDVRYAGDFTRTHADVSYRAVLLLVLEGKVAAARLPVVLHAESEQAWEVLEQRVTDIVERLAALSIEQRISFFVTVAEDETVDTYLHLQLLEDT